MKELLIRIDDQMFRLNRAKANNILVNQEVERTKTILYHHAAQILEALRLAVEAEEKIALLEAELNDAEAELSEMDKRMKEGS